MAEVIGRTPQENARILRSILAGERGPRRDIVVMNAAAALVAANKVSDFKEGVRIAEEVIDSGRAYNKLNELIRFSNNVANVTGTNAG